MLSTTQLIENINVDKINRFYHPHQKNNLLLIKWDYENKTTTVENYSINDLTKLLLSVTLEGFHSYSCTLPNGTVLLTELNIGANTNNRGVKTVLTKLCPQTFEVISQQDWINGRAVGVINNNSFFVSRYDEDPLHHKNVLYFYAWSDEHKKYIEKYSQRIPGRTTMIFEIATKIQALGNNKFCIDIQATSQGLLALIVEVNPDTYETEPLHLIRATPNRNYYGGEQAGGSLLLPNGNLLTYYDDHHDHVQIWEMQTYKCIESWQWREIAKENPTFISKNSSFSSTFKLSAFFDDLHLLVQLDNSLFLFNMETQVTKKIEVNDVCTSHILPNGKILVQSKSNILDNQTLLHGFTLYELEETLAIKNLISSSQHYATLFFNRQHLPPEITQHIFSYAFTRDAKKQIAGKAMEGIVSSKIESENKSEIKSEIKSESEGQSKNKNRRRCSIM